LRSAWNYGQSGGKASRFGSAAEQGKRVTGHRATIVDVGRLAGVSTKSVTRVLNDAPRVTDDLRRRVRAAAEALNYHPNMLARALVSRRSHLVGLVCENPSPSYVTELQKGVLGRLEGSGYRLVVLPTLSSTQQEGGVVGLVRSAGLDGVVLAPPVSDDIDTLTALAAAHIACARVCPAQPHHPAPAAMIDEVAAGREATAYLIGLGHRVIATIRGDPRHAAVSARFQGYREALMEAGLPFRPDLVADGMFTRASGMEAALRLLSGPAHPTAIFAQNDDMAVGAIAAARQHGLAVPDDVSVVGFDDSEIAIINWPALTTVRQPVFEMAVDAADMVLAQLNGEEPVLHRAHRHQLQVRGSTAPPPRCAVAATDRKHVAASSSPV
jgi:LacI family transcriptional regulator